MKLLYKVSKGRLNKPFHLAQLVADIVEEARATDGKQCWQTSQHVRSQWQLSLLDMKACLTLVAPMKASSCLSDLSSTSTLHIPLARSSLCLSALLYATIGNKTITIGVSKHNIVFQ